MCVAILTTPGNRVTNERLWQGWTRNKDGGGFAYVDPDKKKVVISKGFLSYNEFQKAYDEAVAKFGATSPFLIHMRVRTSGDINDNNTHPFEIKGGALIHNGILFSPTGKDIGPPDDRKSDTRVFAERLFNILDFESVKETKLELEKAINYNKIAMLYDSGDYVILNESKGNWTDGVWYSNNACDLPQQYNYHGRSPHNFRD